MPTFESKFGLKQKVRLPGRDLADLERVVVAIEFSIYHPEKGPTYRVRNSTGGLSIWFEHELEAAE